MEKLWFDCWREIGADGDGSEVFIQLVKAYSEAHRHYHNLNHLAYCLRLFDQFKPLAKYPDEVAIALWFHDAIYDLEATDNEERSAIWAGNVLDSGGVSAKKVDRVKGLILATRHESAHCNEDEALLTDIDLAILGADTEDFAVYEQQIRKEYGHLPNAIFNAGRLAVLQQFLAQPRIFQTLDFYEQFEVRARHNLEKAVTQLLHAM